MIPHTPRRSAQSGQIALIVLLLMAVLLIMGLSLASRTTQEVFLSQQSSETARVWNAAESGAEEALSRIAQNDTSSFTRPNLNESDVSVDVAPGTQLETSIPEMGVAEVKLQGSTTLRIQWDKTGNSCAGKANLIASVFYDDAGVTRVRHELLGTEVSGTECFPGGNFPTYPSNYSAGYYQSATLAVSEPNPLFVRIKPLHNDTAVRVSRLSGADLPTQQYVVTSNARNTVGNEERTVQVVRSLPIAPAILDYAVYSGGSITKQ